MDDDLRRLEREAARGDPEAVKALAAARIRAASLEGIWDQFDYAFDLVQLRPWDKENVALLKDVCARLPTTAAEHIQDNQQNVVIDPSATGNILPRDFTGAHLRNVVIRGGLFGPGRLLGCSRVVILNGRFGTPCFGSSSQIIILGGWFRTDLHYCDQLSIIEGSFTNGLAINSSNAIVLGGTFTGQASGRSLTILGGTFPEGRFASTLGENVHVWLPSTCLLAPAIPCDAVVVAAEIDSVGVDDVWRTADRGYHAGMGRRGPTRRTAFYLRACPQQRWISPELQPLFFCVPQTWDILPLLNADKTVDRTNIAAWLDLQAERLRQIATPCFPPPGTTPPPRTTPSDSPESLKKALRATYAEPNLQSALQETDKLTLASMRNAQALIKDVCVRLDGFTSFPTTHLTPLEIEQIKHETEKIRKDIINLVIVVITTLEGKSGEPL